MWGRCFDEFFPFNFLFSHCKVLFQLNALSCNTILLSRLRHNFHPPAFYFFVYNLFIIFHLASCIFLLTLATITVLLIIFIIFLSLPCYTKYLFYHYSSLPLAFFIISFLHWHNLWTIRYGWISHFSFQLHLYFHVTQNSWLFTLALYSAIIFMLTFKSLLLFKRTLTESF